MSRQIFAIFFFSFFVSGSLASAESLIRADQIRAELKEFGIGRIEFSAPVFKMMDLKWVQREFMPFYLNYLKVSGATYRDEGVDCDNFCVFFQAMLFQKKVASGHLDDAVSAAAVLYADVGPGRSIRHVLILLRTTRGWYVVEGENGQVAQLRHFIRRNNVLKAVF